MLRASVSREESEINALRLFSKLDKDRDGSLSKCEFILGLDSLGDLIDLSSLEAGRLFDKLDVEGLGTVSLEYFCRACSQMRWLRTLSRLVAAVEDHVFAVRDDYNYSNTTTENYGIQPNSFTGEFAGIRANLDYTYHSNYSLERQVWQDFAIKCCLGKTEPHARPWIIYTCGPMGVGKGHVLSWLSRRGLFPIEYIVHIDPDFFKRIMPEWRGYVAQNRDFAGTACHKESGYLQEIAQEVSMRERQHIWVDGSLSDGEWFKNIFEDIRRRYPHYRIAIFYISASEATIRNRITKRTAETGRSIPESQIIRSLQSPEASLQMLAPYTDIVARIWNENVIQLKCVEDYSGNWFRGLGRLFNEVETEELKFPHSLGTLYLEKTSLLGSPFDKVFDRKASKEHKQRDAGVLMKGFLEKEGRFRIGMRRRYFQLRPGLLAYYRDDTNNSLKGEFSLLGNFELLPNLDTESGSALPNVKKPASANTIVESVIGALIPSSSVMKRGESISKETGFYIRGFHTDGSGYSLGLVAPTAAAKMEWIAAINAEICKTKIAERSASIASASLRNIQNYSFKDTTTLKFNKTSLVSSPNLRKLSTRLNPIYIEASPLFPWTSAEADTLTVAGAPAETKQVQFLYPSSQIQDMVLKSSITGVEDPDVLLLLFGGFAYLNADGDILGVMAISETPSQQCLTFSQPEPLPDSDAARLTALDRWAELRIPHMLSSGVKYFCFVLPSESLETTRKYPGNGSIAFIFREPYEPPDRRDCLFSILYDY